LIIYKIFSSADLGGSSNYSKEIISLSHITLWRLKWRKFSWQQ